MAGIVAIFGPDAERETDLARTMLAKIKHRGPDFEGIFSEKNVVLGFVGKKAGASSNAESMPFIDEDRHTAITCDAEIYAHESALPDTARERNLTVESARAIADAVLNSGKPLEKGLEGPFNFVLHKNGDTYAGRDRLGIVPLYMAERGDLTVFASELKAISGLASNIREFPPGSIYLSSGTLRDYAGAPPPSIRAQPVDSLCLQLRERIEEAVKKRLDCCASKKGVFLSGGIDSSIIAALVSRYIPNVDSFTVGMENSEDVPFARKVAEHLGTNHHEYSYDLDEVLSILPDVVYHLESFDAPLVRSATANYIASREASTRVDTILIGEGGDEDFGGYHHVKRLKSAEDQQKEFMRLFQGLHNNGFMRTDRMNWAHSLNVRAPFFDTAVVELALSIHPELKLHGEDQTEKWILRKAFEDYLPKEVIMRPKKQFARGSGSDDLLTRYAEGEISDREFETEKEKYPAVDLRWKEEYLYFKIFRDHFGDDPSTLATVGRWYE